MKKNLGINNNTLKQRNRGLALRLIATGEAQSRVELAKMTGLSKMAATNIITEFLENGYVIEAEKRRVEGKGRNPMLLAISPKAPKIVGVYIYRDCVQGFIMDLQLNKLAERSFSVHEENAPRLMELIIDLTGQMLEDAARRGDKILGIGISALGPINIPEGMILTPPNFYGLQNLKVVRALEEAFHLPVAFNSLFDGAARAEKYYGKCRDVDDFIYLGITTGIGSGVVRGGKVVRNRTGLTSEIGHVSIDMKGRRCSCGRLGCLEAYASTTQLELQYEEVYGRKISYLGICEEARARLDAGETVDDFPMTRAVCDVLACALTNTVNAMNPQKIIIGHMGYFLPDEVYTEVERMINEQKVSQNKEQITVEKSAFEDKGQLYGCAANLLAKVFEGEVF